MLAIFLMAARMSPSERPMHGMFGSGDFICVQLVYSLDLTIPKSTRKGELAQQTKRGSVRS